MQTLMAVLDAANAVIWHDVVLYVVLGVGVLFTLWSGFCQYRAITHGTQVIRGVYDDADDPGAINHFQALSAALSATVGLGNIGGVAVAIALGGPGAVFWMWMIGLAGMALKTTEVALSMIYRNIEDPTEPHGGPMYVADRGFEAAGMATVGKAVGGLFCVTLLVSTLTGGNMFQAWNVAEVTHTYFGVPQVASGILLSVMVAAVVLGGIKRIGLVAGRLVPAMCAIYLLAAIYTLTLNADAIPESLQLILRSAFSPLEAQGAFLGGTAGYAFLWGMKRALFSSEAGQGSSPIAHSAARTKEPIREAVVAGLEPFIDTIVVCTLTAMVILTSGLWRRGPDVPFPEPPAVVARAGGFSLETGPVSPPRGEVWTGREELFAILSGVEEASTVGRARLSGRLSPREDGRFDVQWDVWHGTAAGLPVVEGGGAFFAFPGATLTAKAFDRTTPGLGKWLISLAAWLFALSTIISWSYYGEQGVIYLFGPGSVTGYRVVYCLLIVVATVPQLIRTDAELDTFTSLGTGVMLWANIPIMVIFGRQAMRAYHRYVDDLKAGRFVPHSAGSVVDVVEDR